MGVGILCAAGGAAASTVSVGGYCPAKTVPSAWGAVPVVCEPDLKVDGDPVYGAYFPLERVIKLRANLPKDFMQGVLEHETCHLALGDAHIEPPPEIAERVCDAIAVQRVGRR